MGKQIDIMGTLNAITEDKVIAVAEQIEVTNHDKTKVKLNESLNKVLSLMTKAEIDAAVEAKTSYNWAALCSDDYTFYMYNSKLDALVPLTQKIDIIKKDEYAKPELKVFLPMCETMVNTFNINCIVSSDNLPCKLYLMIDELLKEIKTDVKEPVSFNCSGLSRGNHKIVVYGIDSNGTPTDIYCNDLVVGSLYIESSYDQNKINNLGTAVEIPYKYYSNGKDNALLVSIDGEKEYRSNIGKAETDLIYSISALTAGAHNITIRIESDGKYSNTITLTVFVAQQGSTQIVSWKDKYKVHIDESVCISTYLITSKTGDKTINVTCEKSINGNYEPYFDKEIIIASNDINDTICIHETGLYKYTVKFNNYESSPIYIKVLE